MVITIFDFVIDGEECGVQKLLYRSYKFYRSYRSYRTYMKTAKALLAHKSIRLGLRAGQQSATSDKGPETSYQNPESRIQQPV